MENEGQIFNAQALVEQIKTLTENQAQLIQTINLMKAKSNDPFFNYTTPDPIKNIPVFNGNRKEALAWVQDAEQTLKLFEQYRDDPCYSQIVRSVKNKITGEAREILIASGNPTTWEEIKEALLNAYGDRRDLTSHIQSLFYIRQGKKNLSEYYNKVRSIDTAIKSAAAQVDDFKQSTKAINSFINLLTLTRFIDGLNDEISMHVRSRGPDTLEHAFEITQQYSNAAYRHKLDKKTSNPTPYTKHQNGEPSKYKPSAPGSGSRYGNANTPSGKFKNKVQTGDDASMRTQASKMSINNHAQREKESESESEGENQTLTGATDKLESEDDEYFNEINFHLAPNEKRKR